MNELSITTTLAVHRFGSEGGARALKEAGFEAADYIGAHVGYHHFSGLYTSSDKEFFGYFEGERAAFEKAGLPIGQIHCPFNPPPDRTTPEEQEFFIASVKRAIRAAAVLGAPAAVVHPIIPVGWDQDASISYDLTDRLCEEYARLGEEVGVRIALENMPGSDTKVPYSCAEHFLRLFEKLDTPWLTVCLDTGHANWALPKGEVPNMARALGKHLQVLHLHDNGGTWDNHFTPFGGTVTWNDLCAALAEIDYTGTINLETGCASMMEMSDELFLKWLDYQHAVAAELRSKINAARQNLGK